MGVSYRNTVHIHTIVFNISEQLLCISLHLYVKGGVGGRGEFKMNVLKKKKKHPIENPLE